MTDLPYLDVDDIAKRLDQFSTSSKDQARTELRKFVEAAHLLVAQHATLREIAMEQARQMVALEIENEALKSAGQAVVTPEHFWNLETAILAGIRGIFSEQSESAYQPVVKKRDTLGLPPQEIFDRYISVYPAESVREGWHTARCDFEDIVDGYLIDTCTWETSGNESVVEDAAWAHVETHDATNSKENA